MITGRMEIVFNLVGPLTEATLARIDAVVSKTARIILDRANASMEGAKHGHIYSLGKGRYHQASAPGEPPAIDMGNLRGSGWAAAAAEPHQWLVGYNAKYAPILEGIESEMDAGGILDMADIMGVWAAPRKGRMAPRPFLRPALAAARDDFESDLRRAMRL